MDQSDPDALDVLVIGAGQAGLAIGWHLAQQQRRFVIVDAAPSLGHAWRTRWDSLRLFSPAQYDGLPGMDFPAPRDTYPTKDQVADYLTAYADRFQLPVLLGHRVTRLTHHPDAPRARFTAHTCEGPLRARQVVVATGAFQRPRIPDLSARFDRAVTQLHSAEYRNPDQLPDGPVLVVGAGNSGLQISEELAVHSRCATRAPVTSAGRSLDSTTPYTREVHLSVGATPTQLPQRFLGRDLFWWLTRTGAINKPATSPLARRFRARGDLVIGTSRQKVADLGVTLRPRVVDATPAGAVFEDGSRLKPGAVVWATGFCPDYSWVDIPAAHRSAGGAGPALPAHDRGVSPVSGLHFLGLPWQHTRGSALLGFVREDAAWLADRIHEAAC
jgi:putative flavoprotein involved in K+ transport